MPLLPPAVYRWAIGLVCGCFMCGCAPDYRLDLNTHVIQFDPDGNTVNPLTGHKNSNAETEKQFAGILNGIKTYLANKPNATVLIYVHGGLNSPSDAIDAAQDHLCKISRENKNCYPVFVIWDSSLGSTYLEHAFQVRQGRKDSETETWGMFDFPVYFISDFFVAIARAPTVWLQQGSTDINSVEAGIASIASYGRVSKELSTTRPSEAATRSATPIPDHAELWMERKQQVNTAAFYLQLNRLYFQDSRQHPGKLRAQIAISIGPDDSKPVDWFGRASVYAAFLPAKLLLAPLVDALGTPAWRDMLRRAQTAVDGPSDFRVTGKTQPAEIADYVTRGTDGGLEVFIDGLANASQPAPGSTKPPWHVTLIAHSAGSIVLNSVLRAQTLRETQSGGKNPLPVQNIVYMAAACTIREYTESVVPFMEMKSHADSNFYDLTLHPSAEQLEADGYELIPRGSLLCWLDDFLVSPQTPLDLTLGRWDNILQVPYVIPPSLRGRTAIKAFSFERPFTKTSSPLNWQPQIHSDFTDSPFWKTRFWQPDPPLDPDNDPRIMVASNEKERFKAKAPHSISQPGD